MIAEKQNFKKIRKKEAEFTQLLEQNFDPEKMDPEYLKDPIKPLIEEKADSEQQKFVTELFGLSNKDLNHIELLNLLKYVLLVMECYRFKGILETLHDKDTVSDFIKKVESCHEDPNNDTIELLYEEYRKHMDHSFGDIDAWEYIKIIKEGRRLIKPVIEDLREKVEQNTSYFIESVQYQVLENRFVLYYVMDYYRPEIQSMLQDTFKDLIIELNSLLPDSLNQLDLYKIEKYKKIFQEQKDELIPPSIAKKTGMEQNDILKLQAKAIHMFSLMSFDFIFQDIKDIFILRENNRIRLASVLYDIFLVTHRAHPVYEFYTEEEWWDEQDRKGNLPNNRKWKNHRLIRVRNIIPNF